MATLLAGVVGCTGHGQDMSSARGRPLPPLMTPQRYEELQQKGAGVRAWPASRDVQFGVEYVYETGHCGLNHNLDFDGSFWRAINPYKRRQPSSLINYDQGYITLLSEDRAMYEASNGNVVELRRIEGPVVIPYCA